MEKPDTTVPLSCGEAWISYFRIVDGEPQGDAVDAMQHAFDAGWKAAMAAMRKTNSEH